MRKENVNNLQFPFVNSICTNVRLHISGRKIARIPILIKIILLFVFAIELVSKRIDLLKAHGSQTTSDTKHKRNTNANAENQLKMS